MQKGSLKGIEWNTKSRILVGGITAGAMVVLTAIWVMSRAGGETVVYRETQVKYGTLMEGVTESGSVDIGTVEQTFDLDMSALQRVETGGTESVRMDMFSQIFSMGGNNVQSSGSDSSIMVSEVYVSVGQQVAEGDVLYELEEESVEALKEYLQTNVKKAKADLDAVYANQELSQKTAEYTYESSIAYGDYAQVEYDTRIWELQNAVEESEISLERAKESLALYEQQLALIVEAYEEACEELAGCQWSVEHSDAEDDIYTYVNNYQELQSAQTAADNLERQKEQLEKNVEQAQENLEMLTTNCSTAKRNLEQGTLTAKQTYDLRMLAYETAQETYDVTVAYLEDDVSAQETIYQEALDKWEEFSSYIAENAVCAKYNGVITSVDLSEGDEIHTGSLLITLYDMDEVSMTVTVYEQDMADIALGSEANIIFTAYPDSIFRATVTEISDASVDSDGNVTYDVSVTIQGDVSGLFQGMTGDITFVTNQSQDVLYVSRRAVVTEKDKSYVKVRDDKGSVILKEVTTGFTDGVNVEIVEGLSEGDTVLIESRVSGS